MDQSRLVAPRRRIILVGTLLLGVGFNVGCSGQCQPAYQTQTFPISPTEAGAGDASIDDLIARCQASSSDCTPLCDKVLPTGDVLSIKSCGLVTVDGGPAVRVVWASFCG